MKLVLMEKGLSGFINGDEVPPIASSPIATRSAFKARSERAYSQIALGVEKSLQVHIIGTTDPKEAWEILEKQFNVVSVSQVVRLNKRFYAIQMKENDSMMQHLTHMTSLAQQLRDLGEEISPRKFASTVLGSLPESYANFITSLNGTKMDELDWESIKGALIEEEIKRKENNANRGRDEALFTTPQRGGGNHHNHNRRSSQQRNNFSGNPGNSNKSCFNCSEFGHLVRNCPHVAGNNNNNNNYSQNNNNNNSRSNFNNNRHNGNNDGRWNRDQGNFVSSFSNMNMNGNFNNNRDNGNNDGRWNRDQGNFVSSFSNMNMNDNLALSTNNYQAVQEDWFIDSAASIHMTFDKNSLVNYIEYDKPKPIGLGDDTILLAMGEGTLHIPMFDPDTNKQFTMTLSNVHFVPKLTKNLLSVGTMTTKGAEVLFDNDKCIVHKDGRSITIGHAVGKKLYLLNNVRDQATFVNNAVPSSELWHYRLGHLNMAYVEQLIKGDLVSGMKSKSSEFNRCEPCILGKMKRASFPKKSESSTTQPLELVHTDVCGPLEVPSHGGSRYFLSFTDDFSRYTVVYFLRNKSEVLSKLKEYTKMMESSTGSKIKRLNIIRSDNGGEYSSNDFKRYCHEFGITHQFTNPYSPEQNGVSERFNRTIMETARSMLIHAHLPLAFWAEAVSCATHLRNRSPSSSIAGKTPFECWFGQKPDLSNLRVFGCVSYSHIPNELRKKLDPKANKCVFMGYPEGTKGYKLYNLNTKRFSVSRSVLFCEEEFHNWDENNVDMNYHQFFANIDEFAPTPTEAAEHETPIDVVQQPQALEYQVETDADEQDTSDDDESVGETYEEKFLKGTKNLGRTRTVTKQLVNELGNLAAEVCLMTSLVAETGEPKSTREALNDRNWYNAMKSEISSLEKNETWDLVPRPQGKNIVGSRWVYKIKRNSDGSINRYKARLVAQGYSQVQGVDYNEVFSPVARFSAIRSLLAIANENNYEIHQMDVETAFLNGTLDYEIYMEQPKGFQDPNKPDHVCRLKKSLYGLKQSARCWNATLDDYLLSEGYTKSDADDCIYVKLIRSNDIEHFVILAVYVDDVVPISDDVEILASEKAKLKERFVMVDNGEIDYLLGLLIKRDRNERKLSISQPCYLENILERFNMTSCNPVATPMETGRKFSKLSDDEAPFTDTQLYQQAVGCLMYAATTTRPDIASAIGILAQYMSAPSMNHWSGIKRILRYIKGTLKYGLLFTAGDTRNHLVGYSDSDWAGDIDTRRSTSGYSFLIGCSLVSWSSRKQATVAKSSTEAEYVALSFATQEAIWLRRLLRSIGCSADSTTTIYEDNQGAIELSRNPKHHNRTKHIDTSFHFTRERVVSKEVSVQYCPTSEMIADAMTKALPRNSFQKLRNYMGVVEVNAVLPA